MSPNVLSQTESSGVASSEPRGFIPVVIGAAVLAVRKYLKRKAAAKGEPLSRGDFYAEMVQLQERLHGDHLALLEKLDVNHRELLAALERQAARINALESGLARVDERTRN